jgi:glycosyltransferase involved in cell wall biosynthesis
MRILQLIHNGKAGGVKTLEEIIGGGLVRRGFSVETALLFPDAGAVRKAAGAARAAWRILTGRYDVLIGYQPSASLLIGLAGWLAGCPLRVVHQTALPTEIKPLLRRLDWVAGALGLYTVNVVNSHATLAAFAHYPQSYRGHLLMIEHGVAAAQPIRGRAATLEALGIPDGRILLNIGRLCEQKNQSVLIRALARLPKTRLVVAGDGPELQKCQGLAAELGVLDRLHLLGDVTRDDIADLLAACDLFVFPSTWETFGLAAVEAAMAGVPIIAADLPVLREVLSAHGEAAATFVPPFDVDGWTQAIAQAQPAPDATTVEAIAHRYSLIRMIDAYATLFAAPQLRSRTSMSRRRLALSRFRAGKRPHGQVSEK